MKVNLNSKYKPTSALLLLTVISVALSFGASLLGEIILPFAAAAFALLYLADNGRRRMFTVIATVLVLAADILMNGAVSYIGAEVCILALVTVIAVSGRASKAEASFWLSAVALIFFAIVSVLAVWSATGDVSVDGYFDYYIELYKSLRDVFVETVVASTKNTAYAELITEESAAELFSSFASILPAVLMVIAFAISGVTLKLLSGVLAKISDPDTKAWASNWRFGISGIITLAFWVLVVINLFTASADSVFAVVVANLYTVLMMIHAYIGFKIVKLFFTRIFKNRALALLTIVGILLFFNSLAVELLAYFGASNLFFAKRYDGGDN